MWNLDLEKRGMDKIHTVIELQKTNAGETLVFSGTHVPVSHLFQYLSLEPALHEFLVRHPDVRREQAIITLEGARELLHARFGAKPGIHAPTHPVIDTTHLNEEVI